MPDVSFVDLHGDRIAVRDEGQGEALLLIHGMAGSSETWRELFPLLASKYRVIAPDLLGHGRSAKPRTDYSLGAFAVGLRDLLDHLGVAQVTVVGQSLGGGIAMQFLYQHPDYCQRLVLISSGGLGPDVGWILRLLATPAAEIILPVAASQPVIRVGESLKSGLSSLGLRSPRTAEMWSAFSSFATGETRTAFLRTLRSVVDYRGQSVSALNRLALQRDLPTLAIWGDDDSIIPVEHAYSALQIRPDCRLEVLPGVGHFAQVEAPAEVARLIEEFMSTTAPKHAPIA